MELIKNIIDSPLYILLFGGGGIIIIIISIITYRKNTKHGEDNRVTINIGFDPAKLDEYNVAKDGIKQFFRKNDPSSTNKHEKYRKFNFSSNRYYISFLTTIEEKTKEGDIVEYDE